MPFSSDPFPGRGPRFQLLFADHRGRAPTRFEQLLDRHQVIWREDDQVGMHFDELVPIEQLLETRQRAPSVVREAELEAKAMAREWVAGEGHHGTER